MSQKSSGGVEDVLSCCIKAPREPTSASMRLCLCACAHLLLSSVHLIARCSTSVHCIVNTQTLSFCLSFFFSLSLSLLSLLIFSFPYQDPPSRGVEMTRHCTLQSDCLQNNCEQICQKICRACPQAGVSVGKLAVIGWA